MKYYHIYNYLIHTIILIFYTYTLPMTEKKYDFSILKAVFINCTLKKSPDKSNTD